MGDEKTVALTLPRLLLSSDGPQPVELEEHTDTDQPSMTQTQ